MYIYILYIHKNIHSCIIWYMSILTTFNIHTYRVVYLNEQSQFIYIYIYRERVKEKEREIETENTNRA